MNNVWLTGLCYKKYVICYDGWGISHSRVKSWKCYECSEEWKTENDLLIGWTFELVLHCVKFYELKARHFSKFKYLDCVKIENGIDAVCFDCKAVDGRKVLK